MGSGRNDCRIYVGNLPPDIRDRDLEDLFHKFGRINYIDLKNRRGPPFAFIEFEDPRDAEDAVDRREGYNYDGYKLRVEFPRGDRRGGDDGGSGSYRGSGFGGRSRAPPRRSGHRVFVTGLPFSGSWQDLKDHLREAGDVCYADVFKDGTGVAEFVRREDMKYAIRKLDDTKFRSHEGDTSYIRIKEDTGSRGGKGRRSPSRSRSRSRSLSRTPSSRGSSRSRSRSRSLSKSKSKSRSRSPSSARKSRSRSRSRSKSATPRSKSRSRSRSRSAGGSRSPRSRSRSPLDGADAD